MKRRRAITGAVILGVLFTIVLALSVSRILEPQEPVYAGKTLSEWVANRSGSRADVRTGVTVTNETDRAIQEIGTNGIPTLLKMVRAKDSRFKKASMRLLSWQRLVKVRFREANELQKVASYAFGVLGSNAVNAVPDLIKIHQSSKSLESRICAVFSLGAIGRGAEAAVPVLIKDFSSTNLNVRRPSVMAVARIGRDAKSAVPALSAMLEDSDVWVRWEAIGGLGKFERDAEEAMPGLLSIYTKPVNNINIKHQVEEAVWKIAPERIPKAHLLEEIAPIADRKMTESVQIEIGGRRRMLIPIGTLVVKEGGRRVGMWEFDARRKFRIYRTASGGKERFLGEFTVTELPPGSEPVYAEGLCKIAQGKIFLTVLESRQRVPLEVAAVETTGKTDL